MNPNFFKRLKLVTAGLLVALIVFLYLGTPIRDVFTSEGVEAIQHWMAQQGAWAPVLYVAVYTIATVLCLPGALLSLIAGPLFGTGLGLLYVVFASNLGANICFLLARYLGKEFVDGLLGQRFAHLPERALRGSGLWWIFGLRLLPVVPFNVLNYAAGLTALSLRDHAGGSFLGMLPGTVMYVALGSALSRIRFTDWQTWKQPGVVGALALALTLTVGLTVWKKFFDNRR